MIPFHDFLNRSLVPYDQPHLCIWDDPVISTLLELQRFPFHFFDWPKGGM